MSQFLKYLPGTPCLPLATISTKNLGQLQITNDKLLSTILTLFEVFPFKISQFPSMFPTRSPEV